MANQANKGIKRLLNACVYSYQGFKAAYQHEEAFRQELLLTLIGLPCALYLGDNAIERALLVCTLLLIPLTELINSAIEAVVDRFGEEIHELSGRAKDIGSAAVMLAVINACLVWGIIIFN